MAKQAVGTLERHLEKGILAVAVLVLVLGMVRYLIRSPNTTELDGEQVTPDRLDQQIAEKAERVRKLILSAKPPEVKVESLLPRLDAASDVLAFAQIELKLPRTVNFLPPVPIVGEVKAPDSITLVKAPAPPKPKTISGRSVMMVEPKAVFDPQISVDQPVEVWIDEPTRENSLPRSWVTVSFLWDRAKQEELNRKAYAPGREEPIFAGLEVQRRQMRPDGSWRDEDWAAVNPYQRMELPPLPTIEFAEGSGDVPKPTEASVDAAQAYRDLLTNPMVTVELLRPIPALPPVPEGQSQVPLEGERADKAAYFWDYPRFEGVDPVMLDLEFYLPWVPQNYKPSRADVPDRYPVLNKPELASTEAPWDPSKGLTAEEIKNWKQSLDAWKAKCEEAVDRTAFPKEADWATFNKHYNKIVLLKDRLVDASAQQAEQIYQTVEQARKDRERYDQRIKALQGAESNRTPGTTQDSAMESLIPARKELIQQVWVVDGRYGSVQGGVAYQYRMRVNLYNPYVNQPKYLADDAEAKRIIIEGEWSPASDPIYAEPDAIFFARTSDERKRDVSVDIYKWFEGFWVKNSFKVIQGDVIGGPKRAEIEDDNPMVDFTTGGVVLSVDFGALTRDMRKGSGNDGIRYGAFEKTTSLIFMDSDGELHERLVLVDKANPYSREVANWVYKPRKPTEEGGGIPDQPGPVPGGPPSGGMPSTEGGGMRGNPPTDHGAPPPTNPRPRPQPRP